MSRTLQFKRYANTVVANTTGAAGELIIETTNNIVTVHTGTIAGGVRMTSESYVANISNTKVNKSGDTMTGNLTFSRGGGILGNIGQNEITMTSNVINDLSGFTAYGSGVAQIYANTFVQLVANTGGVTTSIWNFNTNGTITFPDNTVQKTAANVIPAFDKANSANILAQSAYNGSNIAFGHANAAFNSANVIVAINTSQNNSINLVSNTTQAAFNTANTGSNTAQAAFNTANTASNNATLAFAAANSAAQTVPQNAQTTNYILTASDAGKHLYYTQAANVNLYIPWTSNASFSNGTTIMIVSRTTSSANVIVTPNVGVSMFLAGNTTSASRNVTTYGMATLIQVAANTWMINGTGVV